MLRARSGAWPWPAPALNLLARGESLRGGRRRVHGYGHVGSSVRIRGILTCTMSAGGVRADARLGHDAIRVYLS